MQAHLRRFTVGVGALCIALPASGQNTTLPPVRKLGPVVATSKPGISDIQGVRVLSDGQVLVNSNRSHRVILLDASLSSERTIDTLTTNEFAKLNAALVAARGDTSLVVNGRSKIDVIDPAGNVVRTLPAPPSGEAGIDLLALGIRATGDRQGRILAIPPAPFFASLVDGFIGDTIVTGPEFVPILRFDPVTHRIDTVTTIRAPRRRQAVTKWANGGRGTAAQDPFPMIGDDWAVLSDGTLAIARLSSYSIDAISPNGAKTTGPRVAHEWATLDATKKASIIASMRNAMNAAHADSVFPADSARYDSLSLVAKANPEALTDSSGRRIGLGPRPVRVQFVAPADLPDSIPPFAPTGVVADADDNLWIPNWLPARPGGGMTFDVVNKMGVLVDRVELPADTSLVALIPGYAFLRGDAANRPAILKARIR